MSEQRAGATPGSGASPDHAYPFGPSWAPYPLPFVGARLAITARDAGVWFEGEGDGDGGGDGDKAGDPASKKTTGDPPPAKDDKDPEGLGEAGKEAIRREREAAKAEKKRADDLQTQLDELKAATQTDQEKALGEARKEAEKATAAKYEDRIRRSEARSALRAAGMTNDKALDLYASAPEFASLKVSEDGSVEGLAAVVDQLKKDVPESFAAVKTPPKGEPTRGVQGGDKGDRPKTLGEALTARYASQNA